MAYLRGGHGSLPPRYYVFFLFYCCCATVNMVNKDLHNRSPTLIGAGRPRMPTSGTPIIGCFSGVQEIIGRRRNVYPSTVCVVARD